MQIDFHKPIPLLAKTTVLTFCLAYLVKKISFKIIQEKIFTQNEQLQKKQITRDTPKKKAAKAVADFEGKNKADKKANKVFKTLLTFGFLGNFLLTLYLINKKRIKKIG